MNDFPPRQSERREANSFEHCPRYDKHELSEEQILDIAKKAVTLARDDFYREVGQSVISKFFLMVGSITVIAFGILTHNGYFDK